MTIKRMTIELKTEKDILTAREFKATASSEGKTIRELLLEVMQQYLMT